MFLPIPLSSSSLRCVCVAHSLSFVAQDQPVEKHTLGVLSHHVSVWSLILHQWQRSTVPEQSRAAWQPLDNLEISATGISVTALLLYVAYSRGRRPTGTPDGSVVCLCSGRHFLHCAERPRSRDTRTQTASTGPDRGS